MSINQFTRVANDLSLFIVIVGVRGGGKTLLMTHFACEILREIYVILKLREINGDSYLPKRKTRAWSNYPVRRLDILPITGKRIYLESEPLDIEKLILWHDDFHDGVIFFDEIDQVADRQDWQSTVSKMINMGVQVMRHRNLTFITSVQSMNWLNVRLQWQADLVIQCRDSAFSQWGRSIHLQPGEVIDTRWFDKSGIMTGHSYEEDNAKHDLQFFGKRYWNNYRTQHEFNIATARTKYKIKPQHKEIYFSGDEEERVDREAIINYAIDLFRYDRPGVLIRSDVFWSKAEELGFPKDDRIRGGRLLKRMGIQAKVRDGYACYIFEQEAIV